MLILFLLIFILKKLRQIAVIAKLFDWLIVSVYNNLFSTLSWIKSRSFTHSLTNFDKGVVITDEEWKLEEKQEKEEVILIDASTFKGDVSLFISLNCTKDTISAYVNLIIDGRRLVLSPIIARKSTGDKDTFIAGPFLIQMREPFRKWRIQLKGLMRDEDENCSVFVSVAGWWKPTSDARFRFSKLSSQSLDCSISERPWAVANHLMIANRISSSNDLVQWGQLHCEVTIGEGEVNIVRLRGMKTRLRDQVDNEKTFNVYLENGHRILWAKRQKEDRSYIDGTLWRSDQKVLPLMVDNQEKILSIPSEEDPGALIQFSEDLPVVLSKTTFPISFSFTHHNGNSFTITRLGVRHLIYEGCAILVERQKSLSHIAIPSLPVIPDYSSNGDEHSLPILPFTHRACQDYSLTGGKAGNLARLTTIARGFVVPRGVSVTVAAYKKFLEEEKEVAIMVEELNAPGKPLEECIALGEKIGQILEKSRPTQEISENLLLVLDEECGKEGRFAVRSSAVGEDGSELSSAGQLESYMEVAFDDVPSKVAACWASNYRREVINYRRQHGQPLNPPMGVVVQRMIENGVAGVMFTCDPVTLDPSRVVINAFKGKGEDIVSGAVTPDTVTLRKTDDTRIGKSEECCLDEQQLQKLLHVGKFLEEIFGGPQDVEFIVDLSNNRVNVVQSRDVTGRDRESDFESKTEFNSPTLTDRECFTLANLGEVLPQPCTPLFISSALPLYDTAIMARSGASSRSPSHFAFGFGVYNQRAIFNHGELFLRNWLLVEKDRLAEYVVGGQELFTKEMIRQGKERYPGRHALFPIYNLYRMIKMVLRDSYKFLEKGHKDAEESLSLLRGDSILERFDNFKKQQHLLLKLITDHGAESTFSTFTYVLIGMLVRGSDEGEFTPEMLSDIASLFSNGNDAGALSGDVPKSLKKLASALIEDGISADQLKDEENGLNIIRKGKKSGPLLDRFLKIHGHRGPGELTFRIRSWEEHPALIVHTLRGMMAVPETLKENSEGDNVNVIVDRLKCNPQGMRRRLMKYLIKETYRGVAFREECKDLLVKGTGYLRRNGEKLGEMMRKEGWLPKGELIFYFTLSELEQFIKNRSTKYISRAMRRKKILPSFEGLQYEYVIHGNPQEIAPPSAELLRETSLNGTTVCEGIVVAKARVALTIEEANETQPGEILITRYTDICWSPLFPIVKGIVTEVGGLLSHGAVVAREYGLPSLIAVTNATHVFTTGDVVELNATKGIISKVSALV